MGEIRGCQKDERGSVWRTLFLKSHSLLHYLTWQRLNSNLNIMSGPPAFLSQTPPKQNSPPGPGSLHPTSLAFQQAEGQRNDVWPHLPLQAVVHYSHTTWQNTAGPGMYSDPANNRANPTAWRCCCGLRDARFHFCERTDRKWKGGRRVEMERFTYSEVFLFPTFFQTHTLTHMGAGEAFSLVVGHTLSLSLSHAHFTKKLNWAKEPNLCWAVKMFMIFFWMWKYFHNPL